MVANDRRTSRTPVRSGATTRDLEGTSELMTRQTDWDYHDGASCLVCVCIVYLNECS